MIKLKLKKKDVWFIRGCLRDASKDDPDEDVRKKANELFSYLVEIESAQEKKERIQREYMTKLG